jgi:hypothetical protein
LFSCSTGDEIQWATSPVCVLFLSGL